MNDAGHMTPDEFRRAGHAVIERIARYMEEVERYPVLSQAEPGAVRAKLPEAAPERGEPIAEVLRDVDEIILPGITHWQSPNFYAYFPANASGPSILGDLLSSGLGVQGMLWATSPACTELETHVLDWLVDLLGLPQRFRSGAAGGGMIQDSASSSTLTALIAARERASAGAANRHGVGLGPAGEAGPRLTVYTSRHAHSSIEKGVKIAGLGSENLRLVDANGCHAMRADALEAAIAADRAAGATACDGVRDRRHDLIRRRGSAARGRRTLPPRSRLAPRRCRARGQRHHLPRAAEGLIDGLELRGQLFLQPAQVVAHQLRLQLLLGGRPRRADRRAERPPRVLAQTVRRIQARSSTTAIGRCRSAAASAR